MISSTTKRTGLDILRKLKKEKIFIFSHKKDKNINF
jgi:hypothetical protein